MQECTPVTCGEGQNKEHHPTERFDHRPGKLFLHAARAPVSQTRALSRIHETNRGKIWGGGQPER